MDSLAHVFGLKERFLKNPLDVKKKKKLLKPMDYTKVSQILERERIRSRKWLEDALAMPVKEDKDNLYREERRPMYDALRRGYRLGKQGLKKLKNILK